MTIGSFKLFASDLECLGPADGDREAMGIGMELRRQHGYAREN